MSRKNPRVSQIKKAALKVSGNSQAGLGTQLSNRVASGAITQERASKTAKQRVAFKAAYGDDWRTKVYGKGGAKGISGPFARGQVAAKRSRALDAIKNKATGKKFSGLNKY